MLTGHRGGHGAQYRSDNRRFCGGHCQGGIGQQRVAGQHQRVGQRQLGERAVGVAEQARPDPRG